MPIGEDKAPRELPKDIKRLWVKTFNATFEACNGSVSECDESAAKLAWMAVKRKYKNVNGKWVAKSEYQDSYHDVVLTITKAALQPDGTVRWQAVASDTGKDKAEERTSLDLFQDWIDRVTYGQTVDYLPPPKMPFLGVSHYSDLDGLGEAGSTYRMYIDGNTFKADGVFNLDNPLGEKLLDTVKDEIALVKRGNEVTNPVRISAGWWDIQHYHDESDYLFTRESLTDKCPICEKGQTSDKVYKAGQLDHFAATRVPMNVRTSLELKHMPEKITRRDDAQSIVGDELADELEHRSRLVGKSDLEDELPLAMATKADVTRGGYMRDMRKKRKLSMADVAKALEITEARLKRLEEDEDEIDDDMMSTMSEVFKMSDKEKEEMLARFGKKRKEKPPTKDKAAMKTVEGETYPASDFLVVEDPEKTTTWHLQVKRKGEPDRRLMGAAWAALHGGYRGNKYEGPMKREALSKLKKMYADQEMETPTEKMDYGHGDEKAYVVPLGGATSIKQAEDYISQMEKMGKMYSYWDMMQMAYDNINEGMMEPSEKIKATSNLFREMAAKIDTLKAGLSDAYLIQQSTAAYEDYEDYEEEEDADYSYEIESEEVNDMTPEERLEAARKAALDNKSFTRQEQEAAIQKALTEYAQEVSGQLDAANPQPVADQIAGAIEKALAPLAEQVGLMAAKMNTQPQPQNNQGLQEVYVPQQKSVSVGQPAPVTQAAENGQGHAISPVLGKPSPLTDVIRSSVGLHS